MMRPVYKFFFRLAGWKISGAMPRLKKYIIIVAPHTSNIDFFIGLAARSILRFRAAYLAKKELFRFPFGIIFRKLGGYPVDRSSRTNMVDQVASLFDSHDEFILAIAPEGTRKEVKEWKTGFYHIARKAQVHILMVSFDYPSRTVVIGEAFKPGNHDEDWKRIAEFYADKTGKYPKPLPDNLKKYLSD